MADWEKINTQHRKLLEICDKIGEFLKSEIIRANAAEVHNQLNALKKILDKHLKLEDNEIYPALSEAEDPELRTTAKQFKSEMGDLKQSFNSYVNRWPSAGIIQDSAEEFVIETRKILSTLEARIEREDCELYSEIE